MSVFFSLFVCWEREQNRGRRLLCIGKGNTQADTTFEAVLEMDRNIGCGSTFLSCAEIAD